MVNKKTHFVIISILLVLLVVYAYQRFESNTQKYSSDDYREQITSKSSMQVGECFSYEEEGIYYGIILIKYEDDDLYTVALLDRTEKKELKRDNFINGDLICTSNHMIAPGAYGLSTGFFTKSDLEVFKQKFKYVTKIHLDDSKIEVNGGGGLIDDKRVSIKELRDRNRLLKQMKQYTEPVSKYLN
ncbi:hypothetical protein LPB248_08645 [Flavobacterium sp. LPB0248]|uniref:hypothetical protein n=1 Tax=Flavobacterium sp. LPB0248 TaxID=2614441 RepID=UPI0015A55D9E|nr:hypothetical protein [Flavobacterium sp. LPB0248]QLC66347.1 hypothetical protein LPB248_08645 [Flavobacterium sp. LPB0248]